MKVSGFGVITSKGLSVIEYCKLNSVALQFTDFYATSLELSMVSVADPSEVTFADITRNQLETELASENFFSGGISASDRHFVSEDSTYHPILCSIISNDYNEDLNIYTIFLLARDPEGRKIKVADTSSFTIGNAISSSTGATGIIKDITATEIYIETLDLTLGDFIVGATVSGQVIIESSLPEIVFYKGVTSYDERIDFIVDDASSFSVGEILSTARSSAEITDISGNQITANRITTTRFAFGDEVSNGTDTAILVSTPSVNLTDSIVLPLPYISDGADILLRINLRSTSGFPRNISFINTAIREIEVHDALDSSHLDIRLLQTLYTADVAYDLRRLKERLDGIVFKNSLVE